MTKERSLVIVAGVRGSGRSSFAACYKNSFLKSLPLLADKDEVSLSLSKGESFAIVIPLINESHQALIDIARKLGYKITMFYLFAGKILSSLRNRYKSILERTSFEMNENEYELSYKGLVEAYSKIDLIFLVNSQKEFRFISAFDPKEISKDKFQETVKSIKNAVDSIR